MPPRLAENEGKEIIGQIEIFSPKSVSKAPK